MEIQTFKGNQLIFQIQNLNILSIVFLEPSHSLQDQTVAVMLVCVCVGEIFFSYSHTIRNHHIFTSHNKKMEAGGVFLLSGLIKWI